MDIFEVILYRQKISICLYLKHIGHALALQQIVMEQIKFYEISDIQHFTYIQLIYIQLCCSCVQYHGLSFQSLALLYLCRLSFEFERNIFTSKWWLLFFLDTGAGYIYCISNSFFWNIKIYLLKSVNIA